MPALTILLAAMLTASPKPTVPYLHMPSVDTFPIHNPDGTTILPEGRLLKPAGWATPLTRWPYGLSVNPAGDTAFVACDGVGHWLKDWTSKGIDGKHFRVGRKSNAGANVYSADGKTLFWSSGETGAVYFYHDGDEEKASQVSLNVEVGGHKFADSYVNDLALSADGRYLYCADYTNFRVAVIDVAKQAVVASVPVGRYPYAMAITGNRLFVANIGQFEYTSVVKQDGPGGDPRGLTFPPFGYPSKEAENGVTVEGRNVKGLGSPLAPEAFSVYGIDVTDPLAPKVVTRTKTGLPVLSTTEWGKVVGGAGPCFLTAMKNSVFVSNNGNDSVQEINATTGKIKRTVVLEPSPVVHNLRGVGPAGSVASKDGKRLYVAESGLNAIAVIDVPHFKVIGQIPTAWYPFRLALSRDDKTLACICFKGFGNGPRGGANVPNSPYAGMVGSFHTIPVPAVTELPKYTKEVLDNMGIKDASADLPKLASPVWSNVPGKKSNEIKYVVFIGKENHTFDAIFDRIPGSNNDPALLRWGLDQTITGEGKPTLEHVPVMVNHNKLARQFVVSDNFYVEPEASGVGHRWLVGIQPNNYCQMLYTLGYDFKLNSTAPGRRSSFGSNASMAPEDYPEAGSMWDHLGRHKVSFRSYGEGFEFAGVEEGEKMEESGAREVVNIPMPKVLFDNTCRDFANFNLNIPDMYRVEQLQRDLEKNFTSKGKPFPSFMDIALCADHGTGPNPKLGYNYRASYMADNDLALGKIVEFLSHTPYWKNMAIFVTEDDAGGEADHVDAQRSVMLIISPWARHGFVSHRHTTITSMHRTMYEIFGLPALNLFDGLSNDFSDAFTSTPDFTPYTADMVDRRLWDWPKVRSVADWNYEAAAKLPIIEQDDFEKKEHEKEEEDGD